MRKETGITLPWSVFYAPDYITVVCIQAWLHHSGQCTHLVASSVYMPGYITVVSVHLVASSVYRPGYITVVSVHTWLHHHGQCTPLVMSGSVRKRNEKKGKNTPHCLDLWVSPVPAV